MTRGSRTLRLVVTALFPLLAASGHAHAVQIPAGDGARTQFPAAEDRATAQPAGPAQDAVVRETELDRQVKEVSAELRCVVCQGLSIQDSPSTLAQEMRGVVRERLIAGDSPEQVKVFFVERYGEWVLLKPKASGFNLVVYLLPIAMILAGAAFVFLKARSWTRAAPADGGPPA
ncbi:MAG: cytochrome c-type biogenesis protein CcmH [Gemmatimonadetes bacterium]|nr:cytochrome c-type biogenesis protein CcmH [Gemmatimonadota bacterium]